jgi:serine/threonine-protein kinase
MSICEQCQTEVSTVALFCPMCGAKLGGKEADPLVGEVVGDRYLLKKKLAEGNSGTIYLSEHVTLRRKIAVKVIHPDLSRDDLAVERFRREATTVAEIDNDHLLEVYDFGRARDGRLFLAMELLDGESLFERLKREPRLPVPFIVDVLSQLADALVEAHDLGYVHRDIRPRNVYLAKKRGRDGFVKLLDFGLAKLVEGEGTQAQTALGTTFGDPRYMSPEQARGDAIDRRADIYSLGLVAFEMLVGKPPFDGKKVFDILTAHLEKRPERPTSLRPDVPTWMEAVVLRALAKDPAKRFATVINLVDALKAGQASGAIATDESASQLPKAPTPHPAPRHHTAPPVAPPVQNRDDEDDEDDEDEDEDPPAQSSASRPISKGDPGTSASWYDDGPKEGTMSRFGGDAGADDSMAYEPAKKSMLLVWIGAGVLGAVLLIIVIVVATHHGSSPAPARAAVSARPDAAPLASAKPDAAPLAAAKPDAGPKVAANTPQPPHRHHVVGDGDDGSEDRDPPTNMNAPPVFDFRHYDAGVAHVQPNTPPGQVIDPYAANPSDSAQADFYVKLGEKSLNENNPSEAATYFNKAREYDSTNAYAIAGLGEVAMRLGQYNDAAVHLERAAALAPHSAHLLILLGQARLAAGNKDDAADAFKKALVLEPHNDLARSGLAEATGAQQ